MTRSPWPPFDWSDKATTPALHRTQPAPARRPGCGASVVTGGAGFLGRRVIERLAVRGLSVDRIVVPRRADYDLRQPHAGRGRLRAGRA